MPDAKRTLHVLPAKEVDRALVPAPHSRPAVLPAPGTIAGGLEARHVVPADRPCRGASARSRRALALAGTVQASVAASVEFRLLAGQFCLHQCTYITESECYGCLTVFSSVRTKKQSVPGCSGNGSSLEPLLHQVARRPTCRRTAPTCRRTARRLAQRSPAARSREIA